MNQAIKVEKTVTINKPKEELYRFWHNFENLPNFMKHLKSVTVVNDKRSHWWRMPLGASVEWDADIIEDRETSLFPGLQLKEQTLTISGFVV